MDYKALRDKILPNIPMYSNDEVKIIVTKLLDFLIDLDEQKSNLENEVQVLKKEIDDLKNNMHVTSDNHQNNNDIENEKNEILEAARLEIQKEREEVMTEAVGKIEQLIENIKKKDEENKLYRRHILSIFRKSIFRFSDTNFYIIRKDDQDFKELLEFFETDELLQKLCDENISSLEQDEEYQKIRKIVKEKEPDCDDEVEINININQDNIEIKDFDLNEVEEISLEELEEETITTPQTKAKYLDILNQYKNK